MGHRHSTDNGLKVSESETMSLDVFKLVVYFLFFYFLTLIKKQLYAQDYNIQQNSTFLL